LPSWKNWGTILKIKQIALSSIISGGARITTVATMVVMTGIASRAMTKEEFGLWAILVSFSYISFNFDFGFRFSFGNRLAAMVAQSGGGATRIQLELFLSVLFFQIVIGIAGSLLSLLLIPYLPWATMLKIHQHNLVTDASVLITFIVILLFVNIPFMLAGSGFFAFLEVNLACLLAAGQSVLQLIMFWLATMFLSFKGMVICFFVPYLIFGLVSTAFFFKKRSWDMRWIPIHTQIAHIRSIAQRGLEFFMLSMSATIITNITTFLAGIVAGLSIAGDFDLIKKIFTFLLALHLALLSPLAPSYTHAAQLGNWNWVKNRLAFCNRVIWPLLFIGGGGLIYILHPYILYLWSGRDLSDFTLAGLLLIGAVLGGWGNTQSVLLNSLGLVKLQAIWAIALAPLFIFLPLYLGKYWGVTGVAMGTVLCMIPGMFFWPYYASRAIRLRLLKV